MSNQNRNSTSGRSRYGSCCFLAAFPLLIGVACLTGNAAATPPSLPKADPSAVGMSAAHLARIPNLVAHSIERQEIPGCVVLISRHGKVVFHQAFGHRQLQPMKEVMQRDTLFDMASLTKPIATATSIMLLVERGEIRLHDRFGSHIDDFNQNGNSPSA